MVTVGYSSPPFFLCVSFAWFPPSLSLYFSLREEEQRGRRGQAYGDLHAAVRRPLLQLVPRGSKTRHRCALWARLGNHWVGCPPNGLDLRDVVCPVTWCITAARSIMAARGPPLVIDLTEGLCRELTTIDISKEFLCLDHPQIGFFLYLLLKALVTKYPQNPPFFWPLKCIDLRVQNGLRRINFPWVPSKIAKIFCWF
jgi:hypothetical protein